jgi:hypothetical protein
MSKFGDESVWALLIPENIKISPSVWIQAEQQEDEMRKVITCLKRIEVLSQTAQKQPQR